MGLLILEISLIFTGGILIGFRDKLSYLGLILCTLFISIPDLYYVPSKADDLSRYFQDMNLIQPYNNLSSLFNAFNIIPELSHYNNNYIYNIFEWIISKIGNYALLAFLTAFIVYLFIYLPIVHEFISKKINLNQLFIGVFLITSLFSYSNVSSTVRWYIGLAIFYFILYINCKIKHPFITIPLYLLLLFIHQGLIIPVFVAILCILIKYLNLHRYIYIIFGTVFFIIVYLSKYVNSGVFHIFNAYNSINLPSLSNWYLNQIISLFGILIISYIYMILGAYLIHYNQLINFHLEKIMLIMFTITDLLLLFSNIMIPARYSACIGFIGILIYMKTIYYKGFVPKRIKYIYIITAILYILLTWSSAILDMTFNFSQINYTGLIH